MKLIMLKGLPASGKSTYAKKLVDDGWVRINKDDLREMLNNGKWSSKNEKLILHARNVLITNAFNLGKNVVVDDTNFAPHHEATLKFITERMGAEFSIKFIDTPVEECIKRDLKRANSVGSEVILDMYNTYLKPAPKVVEWNPDLPTAIICDIDGTLAHGINVTRKPYEWDKVDTDTLDPVIADLIGNTKHKVILMSGRDGSCWAKTVKWLAENHVNYDYLFMRAEGDTRKDSIVKEELYIEHIEGKYNVEFVLDDRNQVVEMWRQLGLKCFQVAEGNF